MFHDILLKINKNIINPIIFLLIAAAALVFLFGVARYVLNFDSDTARSEGRKHMLWGVIGLFIMLSVYGIVVMISKTIGVPLPFPFT